MIKLDGLSLKASDRLLQPLTLSLLFMVKRSRVMAIIGGNQFAKVNDRKSFDVQPRLVSSRLSSKEPQPPSRRRAICTSGDLPTDGREGAEQRRGRGGAEGDEGEEG